MVEDLDSSNGTFVNHQEVHAPTIVTAGDELLIGTSVIQLRSPAQIAIQASAVRQVPPALAIPERRPTFVDPADEKAAAKLEAAKAGSKKVGVGTPELDRLKDSRAKAQARLAPFAMFILVALVVAIYLGTQST